MNTTPELCAPYAEQDMADVLRSDVVVVFTHQPSSTGGRHVELGMALAAGKRVIICGDRENIFQTLPQVEHCDTDWDQLIKLLGSNHA
jgi:nucleoside 2-deoxyribosyltransferase